MDKVELTIQNGSIVYHPVVEEDIIWETSRKGVAGKLTFRVIMDDLLNFQEGNRVTFKVGGVNVFSGFVFTKKRSKFGRIDVVAYDQLRYLKNKDTINYAKKTASDLVKDLASKFKLQIGTIEDTGFVIVERIEEDKTLFDMIQNALDLTLDNKKKMFVLYDDFGKLTLKNIESMKLDLMIDDQTAEDYDYTSSIDGETYNQIKLAYDNDKTKKREIYQVFDSSTISQWGLLQYFEKIQDPSVGKSKAEALLGLYNQKTRSLSVSNAIGDVRVRGGSSPIVSLNLGDIMVNNYMVVETVKHRFKANDHRMDLTLKGGVINA